MSIFGSSRLEVLISSSPHAREVCTRCETADRQGSSLPQISAQPLAGVSTIILSAKVQPNEIKILGASNPSVPLIVHRG